MKNIFMLLAVPLALGLSACGSKNALEDTLASLPVPSENPAPSPTAAGKNNQKEFKVLRAGLSLDPYVVGMYQLVVSNEDHGSACYGLGNTFVKIPVSKTNPIGRHTLRHNDRTWNAVFSDGAREYREETGYTEIMELTTVKGRAKLNLGIVGSDNFLEGEIEFENCL